MGMVVTRFAVFLVTLDPVRGSEMRKTRPCVVVSPDEMNRRLQTVIVAPLTSNMKPSPFRVRIRFANQEGSIALDQLRTIDKSRLVKPLGRVSSIAATHALDVLREMFAE